MAPEISPVEMELGTIEGDGAPARHRDRQRSHQCLQRAGPRREMAGSWLRGGRDLHGDVDPLVRRARDREPTLSMKNRLRELRAERQWSQSELGDRLGVSGNYISMIELAKKQPGPSLRKLFEALEHSPLYTGPRTGDPGLPPNGVYSLLSAETLERNFGEVAEKLASAGPTEKKRDKAKKG